MGDRISISFKNKEYESVTLFSHWDGKDFLEVVDEYLTDLKENKENIPGYTPLGRLDPETVIVDFIRYLTSDIDRVVNNYYLGATKNDGDNSDNGHWIFDLQEGKFIK